MPQIIVFISGAVVMALEILGSRLLVPWLGNSTIVWTSLIGGILASLTLGYFWGGILADKGSCEKKLAAILFFAGASIILLTKNAHYLIPFIDSHILNLFISSIISVLTIFGIPSILLAMVGPITAKIALSKSTPDLSGKIIGTLSAFSALGSIAGTFSAGFFLLGKFQTTWILIGLGVVLIVLSLLMRQKTVLLDHGVISLFLFLSVVFINDPASSQLTQIETRYSVANITNQKNPHSQRTIRSLSFDPYSVQSQVFYDESQSERIDFNNLLLEYSNYFRLGNTLTIPHRALMLGGGSYVVPRDFLRSNPDSQIDVVEIDEGITKIAQDYFDLREDSRLSIFHEDARRFINKSSEKYDLIFVDIFGSSLSIPFQVVTHEAFERMNSLMNPSGVLLMNAYGSLSGSQGALFRSIVKTIADVFPHTYLLAGQNPKDINTLQSFVIVSCVSDCRNQLSSSRFSDMIIKDTLLKDLLSSTEEMLTDELAPVEMYSVDLAAGLKRKRVRS